MLDLLNLLQAPAPAAVPAELTRDLGTIDPRWASLELVWLDTDVGRVRALVGGDWRGPGPTHLMVHGLGASALSWVDTASELVAAGEAIVAVDLPGFGLAEPDDDFGGSLDDLERAVLAAAGTIAADRFVLHGNSMGGLLSLRVADRLTGRLDGLVLAAPAVPVSLRRSLPAPLGPLLGFGVAALPGLGELAMRRLAGGERPMDEAMIDAVFHDVDRATSEQMTSLYAQEFEVFRTASWRHRAMLAATRSILPATAVASRNWDDLTFDPGCPVTVVWGTEDRLLPGGMLDEIRARRPHWHVEELTDAGHAPQADQPERYAEIALRTRRRLRTTT